MSILNANTAVLEAILEAIGQFPEANNQTKEVIPSINDQIITADNTYRALSQVTVKGDSNLIASNIKEGTSIFGIAGTFKGEETEHFEAILGETIIIE